MCLKRSRRFKVRRHRELVLPPHLHELSHVATRPAAGASAARPRSASRSAVTPSPTGRIDWVLSSSHAAWSTDTVRRLADALWPGAEVVAGRTPGVAHVITCP
jgi:hypothetical protein